MLLCLTSFYDLFRVQRAVTGMVFVFISVLVDMACLPCSCFYSLYFMTKYYNHGQKSYDTILFVGLFSIHKCPVPPPPHKQRWTPVSRIFSEYTTALSQRTFVQDCRFHFGLRKKARWRTMRGDTGNPNVVLANKINSNYSPQWIPLATDTEVNNCFSIY